MKKLMSLLLIIAIVFVMVACKKQEKTEEPEQKQEQEKEPESESESEPEPEQTTVEWTRRGIYEDEAGNMLSVVWMDDEDASGWYVGVMLGEDPTEDSYGGVLPQEGNTLHGALPSSGSNGELTVTISEEGEDGLLLVVEAGETYHFTPMGIEEASIQVTINTEGWGNIDYAEGDTAPEFDPEFPFQSADISVFEPGNYTFAAWPQDGYVFVKWTKNGEDFSTEPQITVYLDESADFIAVFEEGEGIDYLALVNKLNPLPDGWEDSLETVTITNSEGDEVEVEAKAYAAYEQLRIDMEENDGIYLELDSARRSVAAQQQIMDDFTEKYGADYAAKTVAQPGYSEHHTGLALDLYFKIKNEDGTFTDVYYNEDMEKPEYTGIWDDIHAKLADYGFILRYLKGKEHITGYRYEPWHIRYVDSVDIAQEIMSQPGLTLEEYLAGASAPNVEIDLTGSELYTEEELNDAMLAVKCKFAAWKGCELHAIRYAGDEANNEKNLAWLNSLVEGAEYTQAMELLMDFSTGEAPLETMEPDHDYTAYEWWLARTIDGDWEIVSYGY